MTPIFKFGPGPDRWRRGSLQTGQRAPVDELDPPRRYRRLALLALDCPRPKAVGNRRTLFRIRNSKPSKVLWKPYAPWRVFVPSAWPDLLNLSLGKCPGDHHGQRVAPVRAQALGYHFKFPDLKCFRTCCRAGTLPTGTATIAAAGTPRNDLKRPGPSQFCGAGAKWAVPFRSRFEIVSTSHRKESSERGVVSLHDMGPASCVRCRVCHGPGVVGL